MKKFGFTLAEILIALTIVGVVAAISIPTMVMESKKKVWVTSLATAVSEIENALTTYLITEGADSLFDIETFYNSDPLHKISPQFFKDLSSNRMKLTLFNNGLGQFEQYYDIDYNNNEKYDIYALNPVSKASILNELKDAVGLNYNSIVVESKKGAAYIFYGNIEYKEERDFDDLKLSHPASMLMIDVNGREEKPNRLGRDIFFFCVNKDGYIFPYFGKEYNEWMAAKDGGDPTEALSQGDLCNNTGYLGQHCAARVVDDGFKMNY